MIRLRNSFDVSSEFMILITYLWCYHLRAPSGSGVVLRQISHVGWLSATPNFLYDVSIRKKLTNSRRTTPRRHRWCPPLKASLLPPLSPHAAGIRRHIMLVHPCNKSPSAIAVTRAAAIAEPRYAVDYYTDVAFSGGSW